MAQQTSISWTDVSWNPTFGCSKVSPGCAHCYAEAIALRFGHSLSEWSPENAHENVVLKAKKLEEPLSGRKPFEQPRKVFVNSMSDLFHEQIPFDYIDQVFAVMALADTHTFQVLTKRPERMAEYFAHNPTGRLSDGTHERVARWATKIAERRGENVDDPYFDLWLERWPLNNVWLGTSIENRRFVDRADRLRQVPAAVRFISAEPLLGPLFGPRCNCYVPTLEGAGQHSPGCACLKWSDGRTFAERPELDLTGIDWLIVGGESGKDHRPMAVEWADHLRDWCETTSTAFFMKQDSGPKPGLRGRIPDHLWIQEMPQSATATV